MKNSLKKIAILLGITAATVAGISKVYVWRATNIHSKGDKLFQQGKNDKASDAFQSSDALKHNATKLKNASSSLKQLKSMWLDLPVLGIDAKAAYHLAKGHEYLKSGKPELAIQELKQAESHDPNNFYTNFNLGLAHYVLGSSKEAEKSLLLASKQRPKLLDGAFNPHAANYALALIYYSQNEYSKAKIEFETALSGGIVSPDVRSSLGATYIRLGEYKLAIDQLERAIKDSPNHGDSYYNLACAYSRSGSTEAAISSLRKAIEIDNGLKAMARKDDDFNSLFSNDQFLALTQ